MGDARSRHIFYLPEPPQLMNYKLISYLSNMFESSFERIFGEQKRLDFFVDEAQTVAKPRHHFSNLELGAN